MAGIPDRMTIRPMALADIIDGAMRLYRHNFAPFLGIVAIAWVPALAVQVAGIYLLLGPLGDDTATMTPEAMLPATMVFGLATVAVYLIAVPLAQGALMWAVSNRYLDRPAGIAEAYRAVTDRLGSMIAVIFLTALVVGAGMLACIIPGLIFAFMFSFAIPEVVLENRRPVDALKRSWQLAKYDFWKVILTLFILGLLVWLLTMALAVPFSIALMSFAAEDDMILFQTLGRSVNTLVQVIVQPVQIIGTILLYYDLRIRHEGFDIQLLADAVTGDKAAAGIAAIQQPPSLLADAVTGDRPAAGTTATQPPPGSVADDEPPPRPVADDGPPPTPVADDQPPPTPVADDQPPPGSVADDARPPASLPDDLPPPASLPDDVPPLPPKIDRDAEP